MRQGRGFTPVKGEISAVAMTFYPQTLRRSDLSNKAESIADLLVDTGIIKDDNWFIIPRLNLIFGGKDKENPRVEITIYEKDGTNY